MRGQTVSLPESTRDRHTYIAGATGTGKSTLIKKLISHDLDRYDSLVLLDPHGDLYREVIDMVPDRRRSDLFVIDPASAGPPPPFNIMRIPRDRFYRRRVEFLIGELIRFFRETWQVSEAFGPMFEIYFRNGMLLLLLQDRVPVTVLDFLRVFSDDDFRTRLATVCSADDVKTFWRKTAKQTSGEVSLANIAPYIVSKMSVFNHGGFITDMMGQHEDEVRLESRINSGGIVLVNLDKGVLGPSESRLLGVLLTMQLFTAGLKRSLVPPTQRRPVNIYIDEFQNFVSDNVASMLSEARKFGLRLHLANQTLSQLSSGSGGQNLLESVLGNVGNLILFRLGVTDAMRLEPHLEPFSRHQVQELRNFHALARILTEDGPLCPLIMETLP
ncbi:MAG: type IV secretion system DNA-binding domain-containing protein [Verrucomicrobiota bacterium]